MLLSSPLVGRHIEVRESHLEDGVGDPILVVLKESRKYMEIFPRQTKYIRFSL